MNRIHLCEIHFIRMFVVALLPVFLGPYLAMLAIVVLVGTVTVAAIYICCRRHKRRKALEHMQMDILAM